MATDDAQKRKQRLEALRRKRKEGGREVPNEPAMVGGEGDAGGGAQGDRRERLKKFLAQRKGQGGGPGGGLGGGGGLGQRAGAGMGGGGAGMGAGGRRGGAGLGGGGRGMLGGGAAGAGGAGGGAGGGALERFPKLRERLAQRRAGGGGGAGGEGRPAVTSDSSPEDVVRHRGELEQRLQRLEQALERTREELDAVRKIEAAQGGGSKA